jgi:hypothetical protein
MTFGNLKFEPTLIYLGGKAVDSPAANSGIQSKDWSAWLADVMVSYRLGPGLSILAEGFYASGVDNTKMGPTDTYTGWASPYVNNIYPPAANLYAAGFTDGTEGRNVFGNGWSVFYFWNTELSYYSGHQLTPSGHMFGRGNVEFNPLAWLNLNVNYLYIMNSANKFVGHIYGAQSQATPAGFTGQATGYSDKTFVGQEINAIAKIAIYKDFMYAVGFGYFFPGDVFDKPASGTTPAKTADQGWSLLTNLKYVF